MIASSAGTSSLTVGATYAFKVKVSDNYGDLHEYAQNITVTKS